MASLIDDRKYILVVPTYNRPVLLADLLQTLDARIPDCEVYVADSSHPGIQEENRRLCNERPRPARHLGFPGDIAFVDKLAAACAQVDTPYVVLCADDDMMVPGAIEQCIAFLERDSRYVACHGDYYSCFYQEDGTPGLRLDMKVSDISDETPVERMLMLLMRYQYLVYAVCRTDAYRRMLDEIRMLRSAHFAELQSAISLVVAGKIGCLPIPYIVRNSSVPSLMDGRLHDPNLAIGASARRFFLDYLAMRRKTVNALRAAAPDLTSSQAEQATDSGFLLYLRRCFSSATVLGALRDQSLIGGDCHDVLFRIVHDRTVPDPDPAVIADLRTMLAPAFTRGWPRGVQG